MLVAGPCRRSRRLAQLAPRLYSMHHNQYRGKKRDRQRHDVDIASGQGRHHGGKCLPPAFVPALPRCDVRDSATKQTRKARDMDKRM